jgi:hypothetical protein
VASAAGGSVVGGIIRVVVILVIGAVGAAVGGLVVGGVLIFTGSPSACVDRVVPISRAESESLKREWDAFAAQSRRAQATITISEAQATSRGVEYIEEKDVPVEDLQVYFCPAGYGEASGKIKVLGLTTKVVVRGTLDLSGDKPRIQIDSVRAGNLPSAVAKPAVDLILDTGNFRTLDIDEHLLRIEYGDGIARVTGGP